MSEHLRVLLVDDDEVDRLTVARALRKSIPGFQLEEASDGNEGLALLKERTYDCAFLDYRLPGDDGLKVLQKARAARIHTPIIMLTRQADEEIVVEMMKAGASDYVNKDKMTPEVLHKSVQYVIRSHHAEQELRDTQERYALAVQAANDGIWDWDLRSNQIYLSPRWGAIVGVDSAAIGTNPEGWFARIHPEDIPRVKSELDTHLQGHSSQFECEYRIRHEKGHYCWVRCRGLATLDATGAPTRIAGSQTDITERKESEVERERLYYQALEADRRKDEFLAIVSHELRTPLTAILGWIQLIRSGKITEDHIERGLEVIERSAKLQSRIVEDLLEVSQIFKSKLQITLAPVKLHNVIDMAIESVITAAKAKSIEIVPDISPHVAPILGDPDRLQQVIWNLLYNAVKFTPTGGRIEIELTQEEKYAAVKVRDNGSGIRPEFLPFVFERFRQEQPPNIRSVGGLGLGLTIVRNLVELHKGEITANSDGPGRGSTFTVKIPVVRDPSDLIVTQPINISSILMLRGLDVLIVEDDVDTLEMLKSCLQQWGAATQTASSVSEALTRIRSKWPHVLISDIAMPSEDGYNLIRHVRELELEVGKRIPSIALTAYSSTEDRNRVLSAGYQAHLAKPIEILRLAEVIAEVAGK